MLVENYLNILQEGKVWDKVKKVWRDHKGKIIAGTAMVGIAAAAGAGGISYGKSINTQPSTRKPTIKLVLQRYKKELEIAKSFLNDADSNDPSFNKIEKRYIDAKKKYNDLKTKYNS